MADHGLLGTYFLDAAGRSLGTLQLSIRCKTSPPCPPTQRADKSPIVGACAEIGAANDRPAAAKLVGVLRLQRPKRSLSPA